MEYSTLDRVPDQITDVRSQNAAHHLNVELHDINPGRLYLRVPRDLTIDQQSHLLH